MSLIDDALKRARAQGRTAGDPSDAARAESERAASDPWAYTPLPERRGRSALAIGGVVGVLALAGIVAVLALRKDKGTDPRGPSSANAPPRAAVSGRESPTTPRDTTPLATVFVPPPPSGLGRAATAATPRAAVAADVGVPRAGAPPSPVPVDAVSPLPTAMAPAARVAAAPSVPPPTAVPARAASSLPETSASGSPRIANEPSRTTIAGAGARPPVRQEPLAAPPAAPASTPMRQEVSAAPASVPPPASHARGDAPLGPARTHVGSFTAPSGAKIDLGGIVFSTTPVALINGRVVPVGGVVEGLTVVSIEENRVELAGEGVHVLLNLK